MEQQGKGLPESVVARVRARSRDLGGFSVGRILPASERRTVGPVVFLDHMGPAEFGPGGGVNVRPHPHIHLATLTWLFDGAILHRDSTGAEQEIRPGDVNWMVAGRGVVHSERAPESFREAGGRLHGMQLWVGLPSAEEDREPSFEHHPSATLPVVGGDGWSGRVIAGVAYGAASPVPVLSPLVLVELKVEPGTTAALPVGTTDRAVYVAAGSAEIAGETIVAGEMMVLGETIVTATAGADGALLFYLGGEPLDGPRFLDWNFVSSRPEAIRAARAAWREGRFPRVPGDSEEFMPLPE